MGTELGMQRIVFGILLSLLVRAMRIFRNLVNTSAQSLKHRRHEEEQRKKMATAMSVESTQYSAFILSKKKKTHQKKKYEYKAPFPFFLRIIDIFESDTVINICNFIVNS